MVPDPILTLWQMMESRVVEIGLMGIGLLVPAANAWVDTRAETRTAKLENKIMAAINQNAEETKKWVNGSFMRAAVVEAKLESVEVGQDAIHKEIDAIREHGCARVNTHFDVKNR